MENLNCFVAGIPGSGKSTFFINEIFRDIAARDRAVFLIDPHGELTRQIADAEPRSLIKDTCILDAGDLDYPVGFNPLHIPVPILMEAFRAKWADSWGPQLEYLLKMALLALSEHPGATLRDLLPLYDDRAHREIVTRSVTNSEVRRFWKSTYRRKFESSKKEPDLPVVNKIGTIVASPLQRILCQKTPKLHFRDLLRRRGLVLINLNDTNPDIGPEAAGILGALVTAAIYSAVLEVNAPIVMHNAAHAEKQPLHLASLYADEFTTYGTTLYQSVLTKPRKFELNKVWIATQFVPANERDLFKAILGTVPKRVIYRVDVADAELFARPHNTDNVDFTRKIANLNPFEAFIDEQFTPMPDFQPPYGAGRYSEVLNTSRRFFARRLTPQAAQRKFH